MTTIRNLHNSGLVDDRTLQKIEDLCVPCESDGSPVSAKIPNADPLEAVEKTDRGEKLIICEDAEDMFTRLGI